MLAPRATSTAISRRAVAGVLTRREPQADRAVGRALGRLPRLGIDVPRDQARRAHAAAAPHRRHAVPRRGGDPRRDPRARAAIAPRRPRARRSRRRVSAWRCSACGVGMVHVAETRIDSGVAAMIAGSVPLQIVVWRALAGERVPRATVLAAAVGLVGLALVVGPGGRRRRLGGGRPARDARGVALLVARLVRLAAARAARRPVRRDGLRDARRRARARRRRARRRRGGAARRGRVPARPGRRVGVPRGRRLGGRLQRVRLAPEATRRSRRS